MKNKKIKNFTKDQLDKEISALKKDLFNFRFRKINGQLENPAKFSDLKKQVARAFTKLNTKT
jgi:large subunit ribosomal protein L29